MKIIENPSKELDAIFWDFDGVLLNSNVIRDGGFSDVLKEFPKDQVEQLLDFHQKNGGLSRYVKFRYFFEEIRGEAISEVEIQQWAAKFSIIMLELLTDKDLQIKETLQYVSRYYESIPMFIVSGSDQTELRKLCQAHGIDHMFRRIHGSPQPKKQWVKEILLEEKLNAEKCVLVGDSINDYDAAIVNGLEFMGYNNFNAESLSTILLNINNKR
ncbi:MAG: HAD family hydrolase [Balneolales bacterium]|nr:HAD family hydrolase [Balneolales bacterium]